tara:strand:- start:60 stop:275 length:216 start_codon:yes stop_codon:yes gene_type:complete
MATTNRYIGKSKYKGVHIRITKDGVLKYIACVRDNSKSFDDERSAAKCYDLWRIKIGKEPVNILVRKITTQ